MRRVIAVGSLLLLCACTPKQIEYWHQMEAAVQATPDPADDIALQQAYDALPDTPATDCSEWFWTAIEAGWDMSQWGFLSQTMFGESRCDPNAHNPSGASGLMQVMPSWAAPCGITRDQLYDPETNLRCAKTVFDAQGKSAWQAWNGRS